MYVGIILLSDVSGPFVFSSIFGMIFTVLLFTCHVHTLRPNNV